jgi:transcriptional regulator
MYIRANHQPKDIAHAHDLIRRNMFATLIGMSHDGLIASHLPFMFDYTRGTHGILISHMARANPHANLLANEPRSAKTADARTYSLMLKSQQSSSTHLI